MASKKEGEEDEETVLPAIYICVYIYIYMYYLYIYMYYQTLAYWVI